MDLDKINPKLLKRLKTLRSNGRYRYVPMSPIQKNPNLVIGEEVTIVQIAHKTKSLKAKSLIEVRSESGQRVIVFLEDLARL